MQANGSAGGFRIATRDRLIDLCMFLLDQLEILDLGLAIVLEQIDPRPGDHDRGELLENIDKIGVASRADDLQMELDIGSYGRVGRSDIRLELLERCMDIVELRGAVPLGRERRGL